MPVDELVSIVEWRRDVLVRAGYPPDYADRLARNSSVDLHLAVSLLERGCTLETAVDILT